AGADGAVAAALDGRLEAGRAPGLLRDDVDHAADRVGAVERALRPPENLDPLDVGDREDREIELVAGARRIVDADAVDEDEGVLRLGAAEAHQRLSAGPAVFGHRDAGNRSE